MVFIWVEPLFVYWLLLKQAHQMKNCWMSIKNPCGTLWSAEYFTCVCNVIIYNPVFPSFHKWSLSADIKAHDDAKLSHTGQTGSVHVCVYQYFSSHCIESIMVFRDTGDAHTKQWLPLILLVLFGIKFAYFIRQFTFTSPNFICYTNVYVYCRENKF